MEKKISYNGTWLVVRCGILKIKIKNMLRRLFEKLKLIKPRKPHLPQTNVSGSVCNYCKGKGKIFHWEFGQFVECSICQTDR